MATPLLAELKPHHVSIAVTDMDLAIDWYQSVLGFVVERRFHAAGIPADGAFLRRPELRLELWCAAGVKPVPAERQVPDSDLRTAGTKHVAFTVPNLQSHLPGLLARGVELAGVQRVPADPMQPDPDVLAPGKPPVFAVFIRDPFGTLIELLDPTRVPAPRLAIEPLAVDASLLALLKSAGLPTADIAPGAAIEFHGVRAGDELVGVVAMERIAEHALLRSLAVAPSRRGAGAGRALVQFIEQRARALGLAQLHLLTTDASGYFRQLGYTERARDAAPGEIARSSQFTTLCPASAVLMAKTLMPVGDVHRA